MSLFPRAITQEISPLFRMVDDYAALARHFDGGNGSNSLGQQVRSFQPRFDVSETKNGFALHGELPGMARKDVQIEWNDANTLTVSGRIEHHHESGSAPDESSKSASGSRGGEDKSKSTEVTKTNNSTEVAKDSARPKYWVSERSVGQFSRSFTFPSRVDQDNVKASLKDGILEIIVPKSAKPHNKKIEISQ